MFNSNLYMKLVRFLVSKVAIKSSDIYYLLTLNQRKDVARQMNSINRMLGRELEFACPDCERNCPADAMGTHQPHPESQ